MVGEGKAVAMVAEGKERILDRTKIEEMGGIEAVTEEMITSLAGGLLKLSAQYVTELSRCDTPTSPFIRL
jgi:hypothetical protein